MSSWTFAPNEHRVRKSENVDSKKSWVVERRMGVRRNEYGKTFTSTVVGRFAIRRKACAAVFSSARRHSGTIYFEDRMIVWLPKTKGAPS